ncbi:unnamed protein product [Owenia fusiformis]|uniref:Uncharacterized protein n=1 Tax=Owenia fusiformis TaxID=6347 RepID=A0A8J1U2G3_OWEFU|nr:unnamed protein product [Owenia fusiformis]
MRTIRNQGVHMESLPVLATDAISQVTRKTILEGKDINLNVLLIPNFDSSTARTVTADTLQITLKNEDPHLKRNLSISEFITAFGRYKRVIVSVYPNRHQELDIYQEEIVRISNLIGPRFYEYHKQFSMMATSALLNHGIKVDWSKRDRTLLQNVMMGSGTSPCSACNKVHPQNTDCPSKY